MNSMLKHRLNQRYGRRNRLRILRSFSLNLAFTSSCSAGLLSRRSLCLRRLASRGLPLTRPLPLRLTSGSGGVKLVLEGQLIFDLIDWWSNSCSTPQTESNQHPRHNHHTHTKFKFNQHSKTDFLTVTRNNQTSKTERRHDGT